MEADRVTRDLDDSELDAAIQSISALSGSTTPTNYTIDLSVLSRPPHGMFHSTAASHGSPKRRMRKLSRAPTESSLPLPSSPPPDVVDSDDIDGPEDFTMNMEYWMRCSLGQADADVTDRATLDAGQSHAVSVPGQNMAGEIDAWTSRGNDRLQTIVADRLASEGARKPQVSPEESTESQPSETQQDATVDEEAHNTLSPDSQASGALGEMDNGRSNSANIDHAHQSDLEGVVAHVLAPTAVPSAGQLEDDIVAPAMLKDRAPSPPPRPATVEDYFSSPAKPPFANASHEDATEGSDDTKDEGPSQLSASPQRSPGQIPPSDLGDHTSDRVAALEAEVRSLKAALEESQSNVRQAQGLSVPSVTNIPSSVQRNQATDPQQVEPSCCSPTDAIVEQYGPSSTGQLDSTEQTDLNVAKSNVAVHRASGAADAHVQHGSDSPQSHSSHRTALEPMALSLGVDGSPERYMFNDTQVNRKVAQLLGLPVLGSQSHYDRVVAAREDRVHDLQQRLDAACKDNERLVAEFRTERANWTAKEAKQREAVAMHRADSDARLSFLREEVKQSAADLTHVKARLASARQEIVSATERLRSRDEERAEELCELKTRLAASNAQCQEQQRKIATLQAQVDEGQQQIIHHTQRRSDTGESARAETGTPSYGQREHGVESLTRELENERGHAIALAREVAELKDELDLLREGLRVSAIDGADEHDSRDSGVGAGNSALEQSTMSMQGELQNLREELRGQIRAATDARAESKALAEELDRTRHELAQVKRALSGSEEKSVEVERRVGELMRSRDEEIKRRIKALRGEKKQMGRVLMRSWGEKECGEEMPQRYRYAF